MEMKKLYKFFLDEETGIITREEIKSYIKENGFLEFYELDFYRHRIPEDTLDYCIRWRIYSYNPDIKKAADIFYKKYYAKYVKTVKEYERWGELLSKMEKENG